MLKQKSSYQDLCDHFSWDIPESFNMGVAVCDVHADASPEKTALIVEEENGQVQHHSFAEIKSLSNQLANLFCQYGINKGDRIAVLLSQSIETACTHVGAWKAGFISIPLFTLFQEEALQFRLSNSQARVLITDQENYQKIIPLRDQLPALEYVFLVDGSAEDAHDLYDCLNSVSDHFTPVKTKAEDPALIIYTSGTTGNPKGALHAHRVLLGHIPGVQMPQEFPPQEKDLFWTPADWAWIGGLMNILMGAWYHGIPVLAYRAKKFEPEAALSLMERHKVRNIFMPPTALKLMRNVKNIKETYKLSLRTITVAGEPMGEELLDWGKREFGLSLNEYYGQTECNLVVSNCSALMEAKAGSMGRPVPGHDVAIIDGQGQEVPHGQVGDIAVRKNDPVMLLQYWDNPEATEKKYRNGWLIMGDQGYRDEEGYIFFVGRDDDLITSAGYRIGPSEIEDCLTKHEAVSICAVVGIPDPIRTEAIKAFIVLKDGYSEDETLESSLRDFVKDRLSPHEYPRHIEFCASLPMTATGKIKRNVLRENEVAKQA
ncbi:AMP-dependent synthetase and ligase [Candidatus Terasakiella magnetica]|uniref:AMP-dependent synthetase and ligase n=1 Tax=Candidatus Terasakiella magnetica TaxID=1867952 RepID=A0A1C3RD88_9PROT|nr:acyl-CoA synthetase [Candidatus Terasakiella magnetica]SCA55225.1 AMP-dependent synthetase and ligase [Candidatus Terasakiella magnetica]